MIGTERYNLDYRKFSRRWWLRRVRNFLWVAMITVLIWVFADMKFKDDRQVKATIRLITPQTVPVVLLAETGPLREIPYKDIDVVFRAVGRRESIDQFESRMKQRQRIVYDPSTKHGPGDVTIPTKDILIEDSLIIEAGLTVRSPEPSVISLRLDERVHQEVPVELVCTGAELAEPPKATMRIGVAGALWEEILRRSNGQPTIKTAPKDLKDQETGKPVNVTFDISRQIEGIEVRPERSSITIAVQINQRTGPKTLTVTVRLLEPPTWAKDDTWSRYELVGKEGSLEWRKEITVIGAKKDLDRLEEKDIDAYIRLKEEDKEPVSWLARTVVIRFPPDLPVTLLGNPPTVNFKLIERTAPAAP